MPIDGMGSIDSSSRDVFWVVWVRGPLAQAEGSRRRTARSIQSCNHDYWINELM